MTSHHRDFLKNTPDNKLLINLAWPKGHSTSLTIKGIGKLTAVYHEIITNTTTRS